MKNLVWSRAWVLGLLVSALGLAGCGRGPVDRGVEASTVGGGGVHPVVVVTASFQQEVLESAVPVVVDFWAPWCGPCRKIAPALENLTAEFGGKVKVCKLNVDEEGEIASRYGIRSIPALLAFKGGEVVDERVGAYGEQEYRKWFQSLL